MSFFKTEGIVLKVTKISEGEVLYRILFRDYGILSVTKKKKIREKPIDIWYLVNCEIITKKDRNIHTIWNIKIVSYFRSEVRKYQDIEDFLKILVHIYKEIPEGSPHYEIYDILSLCIRSEQDMTSSKILLTHLKIISVLWNLPEKHQDPHCEKTFKFLHKYSYKEILKLWDMPEEIKKALEKVL